MKVWTIDFGGKEIKKNCKLLIFLSIEITCETRTSNQRILNYMLTSYFKYTQM